MINLKDYIRDVKDFPEKGILFRDISPILENPEALNEVINRMSELIKDSDVIVGPDARGFLFGTPVAFKTKKPFVMVRKPGKLPGELISFNYELEYGTNTLQLQKGSIKPGQKVAIIDDLLATGGTTRAIVDLVESQGAKVTKVIFLVELENLNGREKYKDIDTYSLIKY